MVWMNIWEYYIEGGANENENENGNGGEWKGHKASPCVERVWTLALRVWTVEAGTTALRGPPLIPHSGVIIKLKFNCLICILILMK